MTLTAIYPVTSAMGRKVEGENGVLREKVGWGGVKSKSKRGKAQESKKEHKGSRFWRRKT